MSCMMCPDAASARRLCLRGSAAHSQDYLDAGKTERAHEAIRSGSEILAGTCIDMIERPELLEQIKEEFRKRKQEEIAKI